MSSQQDAPVAANTSATTPPPRPRIVFESNSQKLLRKFRQDPIVPIGAAATTAVLGAGLLNLYHGDKRRSQLLMRWRLVAQGVTIAAVVGGLLYRAGKE